MESGCAAAQEAEAFLHRTEHLKGGGGGGSGGRGGGSFKSVAGQSKSTTEGRGNETEQR